MCCSFHRAEAIINAPPIGCANCQYTPNLTLLEQIWPDYDGAVPNPYLRTTGQPKRIIYRNGFVNNRAVSYGEPYSL
ncbi:MAG: hypothetical protein PHI98_02900 [Eubacteriales bacterium]|nr:hypothetical protein [Eubacteriales bacterium]